MILPERVFGRLGANWINSGEAIGPISLRTQLHQFLAQVLARLLARHQGDIGVDALALDVVRIADHGGLRHFRMRDQRAFHFGSAHAMAGDVDHVVDAADDPVIAVLVAATAVAGEVVADVSREIRLDEALVVALDRAHHARPGSAIQRLPEAETFNSCRHRRRSAGKCRRTAGSRCRVSAASRRAGE